MRTPGALHFCEAAVGIAVLLVACAAGPGSPPNAGAGVSIGAEDLGGVVTGASGPKPASG